MDSLIQVLKGYDWLLTSQVILLAFISLLVIFWKRALPKADILIGLPFTVCLSLSIFNSTNLISLIFFIEILLIMSKVIYANNYKAFDRSLFEFIRIPFWGITIFCYYQTFDTFNFIEVINKAGIELSFVYLNLLFLLFVFTLGQLYRVQNLKRGIVESLCVQAIALPAICLKIMSLLVQWGDFILPQHKKVLDLIILGFCLGAMILSIRFLLHSEQQTLKAAIYSLMIISIFPLLIYVNTEFWSQIDFFSLKIIFLFIILEVLCRLKEPGQFTILGMFIIICELAGFTPTGHLLTYYNEMIDKNTQLLSMVAVSCSIIAISLVLRSILKLNRKLA